MGVRTEGATGPMNVSLMPTKVLLSLKVFAALTAPKWPFRFLAQVGNLVMSGQSFLPGVGFVASNDLTCVDRFVSVALGMPLQVLFACKSFIAFTTTIHALHLLSFSMTFQVFMRARVHLAIFS